MHLGVKNYKSLVDWESDSRQLDKVLKHSNEEDDRHSEGGTGAYVDIEGYQVLADFNQNLEVNLPENYK